MRKYKNNTCLTCIKEKKEDKDTASKQSKYGIKCKHLCHSQNPKYFVQICRIEISQKPWKYQLKMHPDSIKYTVFSTPQGQYEWLVMPISS